MKVVLVEQDVVMRSLIAEWLREDGCDVQILGSWAWVQRSDPHVGTVVIDLVDLRGNAADRVAYAKGFFPMASVVALSTELTRDFGPASDLARSLGVSAVIAKPFSRDALLRAVNSASRCAP